MEEQYKSNIRHIAPNRISKILLLKAVTVNHGTTQSFMLYFLFSFTTATNSARMTSTYFLIR